MFFDFSVIFVSITVFFAIFPLETSNKCLEKDSKGRSLFCYNNSSLINSNLPVDCANYSVTELRELNFTCYALATPVVLGQAIAAALGFATVPIWGIIGCVKLTKCYFGMTRNPPRILQRGCPIGNRECANIIYISISGVLLSIASFITWPSQNSIVLAYLVGVQPDLNWNSEQLLYCIAYLILPKIAFLPLLYVIIILYRSDKSEYASFAADQGPLDPHDKDSKSSATAGQQDEESTQREGVIINVGAPDDDNEESPLTTANGNTTCYNSTLTRQAERMEQTL